MGVWKLLPAGSAPVMTAAYTVQELPEEPDGLRIQLVFDRPIESSSLPGAVSFSPPVEFSQRVVGNKVELIPRDDVLPGQAYRIVITNVRDQLGNVQAEPVVFTLTAGATATLEQEPVSPDGTIEEVASDLPSGSSIRGFGATGSGGQTLAPAQSGSLPVGAPGSTQLVTAPGVTSVVGKLVGRLFTLQDSLRDRLGPANGPERLVQLNEQSFQSGLMLYRGDLDQIVVLTRSTGRWRTYPNTWRPGEVLPSSGTRPAGTLDPMRSFGKLWREQPPVKNELGWPVYEERSAVGDLQLFDRGTVVRSAYGLFYVLYADGSWRTFADPSRP
ncbi:MAG: hypothetical protein IT307_13230 [Chloroflexi bacterium]|nr:hypothetical protein [Chloroflexota bacterium]